MSSAQNTKQLPGIKSYTDKNQLFPRILLCFMAQGVPKLSLPDPCRHPRKLSLLALCMSEPLLPL